MPVVGALSSRQSFSEIILFNLGLGDRSDSSMHLSDRVSEGAVPRYFIDTDDGDTHVHDDIGYNLSDDREAGAVAQSMLPDMARDKMPDGERRDFVATIRNERNEVIYKVRLALIGEWMTGTR